MELTKDIPTPTPVGARWAIFDLDNCLANDERRIPLINWDLPPGDERYAAYHADMMNDSTNLAAVDLIDNLREGGLRIAIFTARPACYRDQTKSWLSFCNIPYHLLVMRPDGDLRTSVELKRQMFIDTFQVGNHPVVMHGDRVTYAYDDHMAIVQMYAEMGVPVVEQLKCHNVSAYRGAEAEPELMPELRAPDGTAIVTDMNDPRLAALSTDDLLSAYTDRLMTEAVHEHLGRDMTDPDELAELHEEPNGRLPVGDILRNMARTYEARNTIYGDNYRMVPQLVKVLFPNGVPPGLVVEEQWHLFELILVKLSRFAVSNLAHEDSIHDTAVYAAMIEAIIEKQQNDPTHPRYTPF